MTAEAAAAMGKNVAVRGGALTALLRQAAGEMTRGLKSENMRKEVAKECNAQGQVPAGMPHTAAVELTCCPTQFSHRPVPMVSWGGSRRVECSVR